ncbi:hypothetical protein [Pseudomonas sp. MWU12-2037]|uniref:hypothetical protein n=1 Tax=Pseudomonas sp. MWU12-2037 TaxID=2928690 RepID=UPI002010B7EB|nr:hypothetical protein [Pseudomonas sp. MWU12-2037]
METQCTFAPRFAPGMIVATRGVQTLIEDENLDPSSYLLRHLEGDWGDVDPEDWQTNQSALEHGERLLSVYKITSDLTLWIITERDRSMTTLLLPDED